MLFHIKQHPHVGDVSVSRPGAGPGDVREGDGGHHGIRC